MMRFLSLPWLELSVLTPLVGLLFLIGVRRPENAGRSLVVTGLSLAFAVLASWRSTRA
ncbi:MAG: hypothetical protein U0797_24700 [Gemmataceae bacterium]